MEVSLLTAAFLFFSGAVCYRVLAGLMGLLKSTYFLENTLKISLDVLFRVNESIERSTEFKYEGLVSSGACTEEELIQLKRLDEITLREWRDSSIKNLGQALPGNLQRVFKCETWREADKLYNTKR